tara:strand:- start:158 stop:334 length:177 start_codon:yes stop_codon:yes gene_type:complete
VENILRKLFFTLPSEEDETYTAFVQVAGFKSEEEAQIYLFKKYNISPLEILNERTTIH